MRFEETIGISHIVTAVENRMRAAIDAALRSFGLSLAQYSALSVLESKHPLTNADLARACGVTPQTMNKIMTAMVKARLVTKVGSQEHGLKVNYELSARAVDRLCKAHTVVNALEKECLNGLNKQKVKELQSSLEQMLLNLKRTNK